MTVLYHPVTEGVIDVPAKSVPLYLQSGWVDHAEWNATVAAAAAAASDEHEDEHAGDGPAGQPQPDQVKLKNPGGPPVTDGHAEDADSPRADQAQGNPQAPKRPVS